MMSTRSILSVCFVVSALAATLNAASYVQVLTAGQVSNGDATMTTTRAAVAEGTTVYSFIAKTGGLAMTKVTGADSLPSPSTITTLASWTANIGAPSNNRVFTGLGMEIVNGSIQIADTENDAVFRVDKNTGVVSTYLSKAALQSYVGGAPNINNWNGVSSTGEAVFYETFSRSILQTNGAGALVTLATPAQLEAAQGVGTTSPSSGLTYDGAGNLYWAENNTDMIYKRTPDGSISSIVGPSEFAPLIGPAVTFAGDLFHAPDGWMYVRAGATASAQNILKFDPASPAGTLQMVINSADLIAGPAGSAAVLQFSWFNNNLAFTTSGLGYYALPEPSALALFALGGAVLLRRR